MDKTRLFDFPTTDETPFVELQDVEYTKYYKQSKKTLVQEVETGKYKTIQEAGEEVEEFRDKAKYVKIFNSGKLTLSELKSPGIKVLCYIMLHLTPTKEEIYLHTADVAKEMGYKNQKNVYDGIVDLLNKNVLARKTGTQPIFWVNPNMFFNGSRMELLENPTRSDFVQFLINKRNKELKEYTDSKKD